MNAFISTIGIQTNSLSSEVITAALLAIDGNKVYFQFSENKIAIAEKLTGVSIKNQVKHTFKLISNKVLEVNHLTNINKAELFAVAPVFDETYVKYLHDYSNGLIQFSTPKPIASKIDKTKFESLFNKFVGESIECKDYSQHAFIKKVKQILKNPDLKQKADINYALKPDVIKGLISDIPISLIAKNGSISALQVVDFGINTTHTIVSKLNEYEIAVNALKKMDKGHKGYYSIIVEEPDLKSPQHKIFDNVYKYKKEIYKIEDTDALNKTAERIINGNYKKFSLMF